MDEDPIHLMMTVHMKRPLLYLLVTLSFVEHEHATQKTYNEGILTGKMVKAWMTNGVDNVHVNLWENASFSPLLCFSNQNLPSIIMNFIEIKSQEMDLVFVMTSRCIKTEYCT